uniref:Uncharacterized protein n=2 Tax=Lygus hesperus TaxID=30085 RepID=A0A146KRH4_LYGHE
MYMDGRAVVRYVRCIYVFPLTCGNSTPICTIHWQQCRWMHPRNHPRLRTDRTTQPIDFKCVRETVGLWKKCEVLVPPYPIVDYDANIAHHIEAHSMRVRCPLVRSQIPHHNSIGVASCVKLQRFTLSAGSAHHLPHHPEIRPPKYQCGEVNRYWELCCHHRSQHRTPCCAVQVTHIVAAGQKVGATDARCGAEVTPPTVTAAVQMPRLRVAQLPLAQFPVLLVHLLDIFLQCSDCVQRRTRLTVDVETVYGVLTACLTPTVLPHWYPNHPAVLCNLQINTLQRVAHTTRCLLLQLLLR